jgi:hypothetical protein
MNVERQLCGVVDRSQAKNVPLTRKEVAAIIVERFSCNFRLRYRLPCPRVLIALESSALEKTTLLFLIRLLADELHEAFLVVLHSLINGSYIIRG